METKDKTEQAAIRNPKCSWLPQQHPTIYSNLLGVGITPFDLAIIFGEIANITEDEVVGNPKVKIYLAPEQVGNLIRMLEESLKMYTTNAGPLRSQQSVMLPTEDGPAPIKDEPKK
jgi:hypothetical protein